MEAHHSLLKEIKRWAEDFSEKDQSITKDIDDMGIQLQNVAQNVQVCILRLRNGMYKEWFVVL